MVQELKRNPTRAVRIGTRHDRCGAADCCPKHDGHAYARHRGDGGSRSKPCTLPGRTSFALPSTAQADAAALAEIRRQTKPIYRSICRRITDWRSSSRRTLTSCGTTRATYITTNARSLGRTKVRYLADIAAASQCAIRVGVNCGSVDPSQEGQVPCRRLDFADARERAGALCVVGHAGVHALLRLAERLRSPQSDRSQPAVCRAATRRAVTSGRHGSGFAAGRHHQNSHCF